MADPLSIASSVCGFIAISTKIISMLKDIYDCGVRAKQAPESINHLMEEMQDMNVIFCQVQLFIAGSTKIPSHSNLRMLSIHHLVATLSGCVLIASNLDKYLSKMVGISDPSCMQLPANKTSFLLERIKWALWKEAEVAVFIEDLQRHKSSLNLMLGIIQCHTTAEASESLEKLHEAVYQILESNNAISIQLRELISRHDPPINDEIESSAVANQSKVTSILPTKNDIKIPLSTNQDDQVPDDDAASIRTTASSRSASSLRSTRSLRSALLSFTDDLKNSRPYKRIQKWCMSDDSQSTFTRNSSTRGCSWSMFSNMSLGELSISEISVIELPICSSDLWDSQPYQIQLQLHSAADRHISHQQLTPKWSSPGQIHSAIHMGNENLVQTLLTQGTDIEEMDSIGRTPLGHAVYIGHESICKLLLERGASVKGIMRSAIREGDENVIRTLLALGADIEERDSKGRTPLAYAASMGRESICKLLLEKGANVEGIIHRAVRGGNKNVIRTLLALGADIEERSSKGLTPLAYAASICRESVCKLLLRRGANEEAIAFTTPPLDLTHCIHIAVYSGSETVVRLLLAMGVDIEEQYNGNMTPLLYALHHGKTTSARLLIEKGADLFARDLDQCTVVHYAVFIQDPEILSEILEKGAWKIINESDSRGSTPLHYSCKSLTLTKILIEHGASPNIKNKYGETPYHLSDHTINSGTNAFRLARVDISGVGSSIVAEYLWSQLSPEEQAMESPPKRWGPVTYL